MLQCNATDPYDDRTKSGVDLFSGRNRRDGIRYRLLKWEKKRGTEYGDVPFKFLLTVPNNNLMTDLYISFCFSVLFVVCIITVS